MRTPWRLPGIALTLLASLALACCATTSVHGDGTTWDLRDPTRVDGHATEVIGTPGVHPGVHPGGVTALVFDGATDGILVPVVPIAGWRAFTIQVRFRPERSGSEEQRFLHLEDEMNHRVLMETRVKDGQWSLDTFLYQDSAHKLTLLDREKRHPVDQWYWVALVYDGSTMTHYVNGVPELSGAVEFTPMTNGRTSIGVRQNRVSWFKGAIAEIRFAPGAMPQSRLRREPDTD
jgi:hypothetical protein